MLVMASGSDDGALVTHDKRIRGLLLNFFEHLFGEFWEVLDTLYRFILAHIEILSPLVKLPSVKIKNIIFKGLVTAVGVDDAIDLKILSGFSS